MSKQLAPIPADQIHVSQLAASAATSQAVDWMNTARRLGRIESALVSETVSSTIIAAQYREIAKSRAYEGMPYVDSSGATKHVSSLEEFCEVFLGRTARRCQQIASNIDQVGLDLFETAERVGLRQRDYNALKALPSEDQAVIKAALESGADREAIIEQLVTLTERQIAQKSAMAEELADARADIAAKDEVAAASAKNVNRLQEQVEKLKGNRKKATPDEDSKTLREKTNLTVLQIRADIFATPDDDDSLRNRFIALREHAMEHGIDQDAFMGGIISELLMDLRGLRDEFALPVLNDGAHQEQLRREAGL